MAKNDNRAPEPTKAAPPAADLDAIQAQLGPLDEFRGRAESWMKEITAQVARLAGRTEEEERRKQALDKRLSDIEDRMQSLLTLTEMVSLSKNPFAGPPREPAPAPDSAPAERSATKPEHAGAARTRPIDDPSVSEEHADTAPAPEAAPAPSMPAPPVVPTEQREPIAAPATPTRAHPNDAHAETRAPALAPADSSVADTFPPRAAHTAATPRAGEAQQRLFVLEWARLLAPSALRLDLGGFLGFYVEAGWISTQTAATVRNLTLQLCREAHEDDRMMPLDELHARSILLVSRLQGNPTRAETARSVLSEAQQVTRGDWVTIER